MTEPSFKETSPDQVIHELAMPLIAVRHVEGLVDEYISGTAFMIGPGYALTAYHVIEDFVARFEGRVRPTGPLDVQFEVLTFLSLDGNTRVLPMKTLRIWRSEPLDLAVLALGIPENWPGDHRWKVPAMQLLPPRVDDEIVGFGFANSEVTPRMGQPSIVHLHPRSAVGKVVEIHHQMRDSGRLNFPCVRTNARFDGGMSGGPVLNNTTGNVCGVICSSVPPTTEDEPHISYSSTLWPVVGTMIDDPTQPVGASSAIPLMRLFESGMIRAADSNRVRVVADSVGVFHPEANYPAQEWDPGRRPPTTGLQPTAPEVTTEAPRLKPSR